MKQIIMLFVLLVAATSVSAQDVIVLKDGNTITSKVVEVGTKEIKYKKWSNQNGPIYTISITDIYAINYENGERETFSNNAATQQNNAFKSESQQQTQNYGANNSWNSSNNNNGYAQNTYKGHTKEELVSSAKRWDTAGDVFCYIGVFGGMLTGVLVCDDWLPGTIIALGGVAIGGIINMIFDGVANRRWQAADQLTASHLYKQDFNLGSTRLSAGIDLMNDRTTNSQTLGMGVSFNF